MPFSKVGKDDFTSPSGRHFNGAQVRLWHAHGGKFPGEKGPGEMSYAKGGDIRTASYAQGGAVLGRTRSFLKEPDQFRTDSSNKTDEVFGKGAPSKGDGPGGDAPPAKGKQIKSGK